jgi:Xaa-Pro aminopeptidase
MEKTEKPARVIEDRLGKLRGKLEELGADGILVSAPANREYLSGFTGSAASLLITGENAFIATDFRYYEQAGLECPEYDLVRYESSLTEVLDTTLRSAGIRRLAFEADHATFSTVQEWSKTAAEVEWTPITGLVLGLRAVKDAEEIDRLRRAAQLTDAAFAAAVAAIRPGWTERQLAWAIDSYFHEHGGSGPAFETIVAGSANGARPHAHPTEAPLPLGEPIVIDMGARLNGYCADLTRTVCLGEPGDPQRFWELYNLVLRANSEAASALRPGMTGQQADSIAREIIAAEGYGDRFGHALGHGVGLVVHEAPGLRRSNSEPLLAGNCVTVEPGIYIPGWGGIRIEDLVVIRDEGAEVLSAASKEPIVNVL